MNRRIGLLTVGQSPRSDFTEILRDKLGSRIGFVEAGALDNLAPEECLRLPGNTEDEQLVSRLRDGTVINTGMKNITPLLQQRIYELEEQGVALTLLLCTAMLPRFRSSRPVLVPHDILTGILSGILPAGRLAVICPASEQVASTLSQFSRENIELHVDWLPAYDPDARIDTVAERLCKLDVDLVFLDCFGFSPAVKEILSRTTGKPVLLPLTLMASLVSELVEQDKG